MNIKFRLLNTLIFLTIGSTYAFSQKIDTTYYSNRIIRSIEVDNKGVKTLTQFNSENGENLLIKNSFNYSYFDSLLNSPRTVQVENHIITREYWIDRQDTIFTLAKFDGKFVEQINSFYRYISKKLEYPTEAKTKGIEGEVIISFIVNKSGEITQIKPLTNFGSALESSAIDLVLKYKNWGVITESKRPINCFFRLPINFNL